MARDGTRALGGHGERRFCAPQASASFLGFTGRENDSTGTLSLYNYRARAYSPTLHRFLTEDPLGVPRWA